MWGAWVVIPAQGHAKLLQELHIGHPSICRMKGLARTVIWWSNIDSEIEEMVKGCNECQLMRAAPPVAPLNPLPWPINPNLMTSYRAMFIN